MWQIPQTIRDLLRMNVLSFPDREAFVSVSYRTGHWVRHTWRELDEISGRLAAGLATLGVKKSQKVGMMLTNSAECYYTYLAVHKLGAVFIPINVRLVPREIAHIAEDSDVDYMVVGHEFLSQVEPLRDCLRVKTYVGIEKEGQSLPSWIASSYDKLLATTSALPEVDIAPDDVADILYTSGTTGLPKGVVLTQSNKVACGRMVGTALGLSRVYYGVPRIQNVFPFFTSSGVSSVMMMWLYFAPVVILEPAFDVAATLETMAREKATYYGGAPTMYVFLLNHPRFKEFDTSSLRVAISGAAAMPEEVIRKVYAAWPGIKVYTTYLLTEAGTGGTVLDAADALTKLGSVGLPCAPDQEVRIVDSAGKDAQPRQVGEVIMRGPNIMKEYYKNPLATAETIRNGWLYTGDMAYYDEDGYLFYVDRMKDMIVRGGFNVYSVEVENVLYEHPAVKQCACVAKRHPQLGEDVLAVVVLKDGKNATADELHQFTQDKLADYKRPRDIRFVDQLPVNPTGKIDKKAIRARFLETGL